MRKGKGKREREREKINWGKNFDKICYLRGGGGGIFSPNFEGRNLLGDKIKFRKGGGRYIFP